MSQEFQAMNLLAVFGAYGTLSPVSQVPTGFLFLFLAVLSPILVLVAYLSFDTTLPRHCRVAMSYFVFVGLLFSLAGLAGLFRSSELLADIFFDCSVVLPISDLIYRIKTGLSFHGVVTDLPYDHHAVSVVVLIAGLSIAGAAMMMSKRIKAGFFICLGFTTISILATLWAILGKNPAGALPFWVLWSASYAVAYWLSRLDLKF
jgi:hypothetical protein